MYDAAGKNVCFERGAEMYISVKMANFNCHLQWLEIIEK